MTKNKKKLTDPVVGIRFTPDLLDRLDRRVAEVERQRGTPVARCEVIRELLHTALPPVEKVAA